MTEPKGPAIFYFHFTYCDAKNSGACSCDPDDYEALLTDLFKVGQPMSIGFETKPTCQHPSTPCRICNHDGCGFCPDCSPGVPDL